jgi:uncharacterized caspase-like protein
MSGWALIVGINRYKDPAIPDLSFATPDAESINDLLLDFAPLFEADRTTLLLDEHATLRNIRVALTTIARSCGPEDAVIVYFACHGSPDLEPTFEEDTTRYIVPHDAEKINLFRNSPVHGRLWADFRSYKSQNARLDP